MLKHVTDEEREKVKHLLDERYEQIMAEDSNYDELNDDIEIAEVEAHRISYEGGSLLVPDTRVHLAALEGFLVDYVENQDFDAAYERNKDILEYGRDELQSLVVSDNTENFSNLSYIARELSPKK